MNIICLQIWWYTQYINTVPLMEWFQLHIVYAISEDWFFVVPHGSHLGPLFFITFINEIVQILKHAPCEMNATQTTIRLSFI